MIVKTDCETDGSFTALDRICDAMFICCDDSFHGLIYDGGDDC